MTARQKLYCGKSPEVHELDPANAARFNARTLLIPSPLQVRDAIAAIPRGELKSFRELRYDLAQASGAEAACPLVTGILWRVVAEAAEEDRVGGAAEVTPWWRVTKDGRPNPKLPGGADRHRALLMEEGVKI